MMNDRLIIAPRGTEPGCLDPGTAARGGGPPPTGVRGEEWALRYIHRIEQEEPVDELVLGGLHLWPWVRIHVYRELLEDAAVAMPPAKQRPIWRRAAATLQNLTGASRAAADNLRDQSRSLREADILLYSYAPAYQVDHGGRNYDRILDPVTALLGPDVRWEKFHVEGWEGPGERPPQVVPGIALPSHFANNLPSTSAPRSERACVKSQLKSLENRLCKETGKPVTLLDRVLRSAALVRRYRDFFHVLLEGAKAKAVLMPCYYGERQSGLIWACRELGITTVDIQHGKQGIMSLGYGQWPCVPDGGYSTMPDAFWVWGQESAENLRIGRPNQTGMPERRVTGNMYLAQWADGTPFDYRSAAPDFWNRFDQASRVVLVTLQPYPVERALPDVLVDAIRTGPDDWLWLLRMHPARKPPADSIAARLEANGVPSDRVEIREASRQPLYALLKHCDAHVTLWSSCGYEALRFGVPTIFLDELAGALYGGYLAEGLFIMATTADSIVEVVGSGLPEWNAKERQLYIETDPDMAKTALRELLED